MKVVHVVTADHGGGAARAAVRLHRALSDVDVESKMLVQFRSESDSSITIGLSRIEKAILPMKAHWETPLLALSHRNGASPFSAGALPGTLARRVRAERPTVVNLHWVNSGFLSIGAVRRLGSPIVWTLHDSWPFTGGCHLPGECRRYVDKCGKCPQLQSSVAADLSRVVWLRKARAWRRVRWTLISPSEALATQARQSSLFGGHRVEVVPNGVETRVYRPLQREWSRDALGLDREGHVILFVSANIGDHNKAFHILEDAVALLRERLKLDTTVLMVGSNHRAIRNKAVHLGLVRDDLTMAAAYSAADIVAVPSYRENLPNTILEALACGTPVVAFNTGGIPDAVQHLVQGYLARPYDVRDFAEGIQRLLALRENTVATRDILRRHVVDRYDINIQARRYAEIYRDAVGNFTDARIH